MSTKNHDDLERLLGLELHGRADSMDRAPLGLGDVKGRASSIRRNRRIAAGVGIAAALAVVVPTAITAGGALNRSTDVDPAGPSPVETVSRTLRLDGLERGEEPGIEYFTADGVVLPGEGLQPLDQSYQALVPSEAVDGWFALSPSRDEVVTLVGDFERQTSSAATQAFVSNPDRSFVSWTFPESGAQTLLLRSTTDFEDGMTWDFPERPVVQPVDFAGERSLLFQTVTPQGRHEIGIAEEDGSITELPGYVKAVSASPATGQVAVQTRSKKDASGCFGVVDPSADPSEPVWESCDYSLGAFSPDGRYVLASTPYLSGMGVTSVAVLDAATGDVVTRFTQASDTQIALVGIAWESADTFVAVAVEGERQSIVRFGMDGTMEETVEAVDGDPFADLAYYLGSDRRRGY